MADPTGTARGRSRPSGARMGCNEPMTAEAAQLDAPRATGPDRPPLRPVVLRIAGKALLLAVLSLLLGAITSFAQTVLPDALRPLANSASGWTVPTAVLVWALRERIGVSAVFGALSFECLVVGYVVASQLRGFADSETVFLVIGLLGGPIVGAAASSLRRPSGWRPAAGAGVLAGVLVGEAVWGFTVVLATTGWVYWALVAVVGVALLVGTAIRRSFGRRELLVALRATVAVALAFLGVYTVLS